MQQPLQEQTIRVSAEETRIRAFGRALDALKSEVEADLGATDLAHIESVRKTSKRLEVVGRGLLYVSFEPCAWALGVTALSVHKCLELMEIGHMALHGAYDRVSKDPSLHSENFVWKSPIDEERWRIEHNIKHHQYTNIAGRDPDIDYGQIRLSSRIGYRWPHRLQPLTNVLTWFGFATAINLHVTGVLSDADTTPSKPGPRREPKPRRSGKHAFCAKAARYYGKELIVYPALAGPFWWKVAAGNLLSDVGRDLCAGAIIYCGHVGAVDYPEGTKAGSRARWYAMQAESASNVELPVALSVLCGGLDKQIEHHLFPRLPPNRLREIAPRVQALCAEYGVVYRTAGPWTSLRAMLKTLRDLSARGFRDVGQDAAQQRAGHTQS